MIPLIVIIAVFLVPLAGIIPQVGTDVWYLQFIALFSFVLFGISSELRKLSWGLMAFTLACWFSAVVVAKQHPRALLCLFQVYFSCISIYAISIMPERDRWRIVWAIFILTIVQGIYILVQALNLDPVFHHIADINKDDTVGLSGSHNQIGLFFAVTAPVVLEIFPPLIILNVLGLWFATTSFAWMGMIGASLFFLWWKAKKYVVVMALLLIVPSIIFFAKFEHIGEKVIQERVDLVKLTVKTVMKGRVLTKSGKKKMMITTNPMVGYGMGNFIRIMPFAQEHIINTGINEFNHRYEHAHNDYIEVLFDMGLIGFAAMIWMIFDVIRLFVVTKKTQLLLLSASCILAQGISALGIYTVHTAVSGMMLILALGIFYGETRNGKNARLGEGKNA